MSRERKRDQDKKEWRKNENTMRAILVGILLSILLLVCLVVFFPDVVWAITLNILTTVALVVGLISNLVNISDKKRRK